MPQGHGSGICNFFFTFPKHYWHDALQRSASCYHKWLRLQKQQRVLTTLASVYVTYLHIPIHHCPQTPANTRPHSCLFAAQAILPMPQMHTHQHPSCQAHTRLHACPLPLLLQHFLPLKYQQHAVSINATVDALCACSPHAAPAHALPNPNLMHTLERILPPHALPRHATPLQKQQGKALSCLQETVCPAGASARLFLCQAVFPWPPSSLG